MIRNESLQLASSIAMAPSLNVKPTPLLQSMLDASFGAMPFGENFLIEAQRVTSDNDHGLIKDELSERLANIIRDALVTVKDFGVPLAGQIERQTANLGSLSGVKQEAMNEVDLRYVNVDEPFFDSSVYPTEVRNTSFTYTGVDLSKLASLQWSYPTDDEINAFINTSHPELVGLLEDPECSIGYVADIFFSVDGLRRHFHHNGNVFDFTRVKFGDIHLLLKGYILLAKMFASDDPAPWLKSGRLEDYREMVSMLYNGLIVHLINLKKMVIQYRQIGLAVNMIKSGPSINVDAGNKLKVEGVVYFTNGVLKAVMDKGYSLNDLLVGMYFDAAVNNKSASISETLKNPDKALNGFKSYINMFVERSTKDLRRLFIEEAQATVVAYVTGNPLLKERLDVVRKGNNDTLTTWVNRTFGMSFEHCFAAIQALPKDESELVAIDEGQTPETINPRLLAILNTRLVPVFLEAMGCDLAAVIVNSTFVEQAAEDNTCNQRERVRVAVINALVNLLLVKA